MKIFHELESADSVSLVGPDDARFELKQEIYRINHLFPKPIGVERSEAITQGQLVAKVKSVFLDIANTQSGDRIRLSRSP